MATQYLPCGRGQRPHTTGRNNGWSKHAKFDQYNNYIGQYTKKQTNKKKEK